MKLKLGTLILWLISFSVAVFMASNSLFASVIVFLLGLSLSHANPLWGLEVVPYILWSVALFLIGAIWNYMPRSGVELK